jgi:hypothetical protein
MAGNISCATIRPPPEADSPLRESEHPAEPLLMPLRRGFRLAVVFAVDVGDVDLRHDVLGHRAMRDDVFANDTVVVLADVRVGQLRPRHATPGHATPRQATPRHARRCRA